MATAARKTTAKTKATAQSKNTAAVKPKTPPKRGWLAKLNDWAHLNFSGVIGGLLFFCLANTPSLLPRTPVVQGVACGISFVTGYGLALIVAYFYHSLPAKYQPVLSARLKQIILGVLALLGVGFLITGYHWQNEVRQVTQAPPANGFSPLEIVIVAILVVALVLWLARLIRKLAHWIRRKLDKHVPRRLAVAGSTLLAAIVVIFLVNGVLLKGLFGAINFTFGLVNGGTPSGIYQPHNPIYSGSPQSAIDWNSLGEKGREFVATAPTVDQIDGYSAPAAAVQPSRLYVGLESAPTLQDRVNLLIKDLNRTGAANRSAVLIAVPTGSGGIDTSSVRTVEYLYGGDTTTLGIQYSYLPSWLSFLADQDNARQTGKAVVNGVYDWWSHLDPSHRPKLLLYGESLGTLGADGAFSGATDAQNKLYGMLLAGPPNANHFWQDIVNNRDAGTRQVLPTYQNGATVRFANGSGVFDNQPANAPWVGNRIGIMQNGSDPVVWGALKLFYSKPDWLREQRAADVLPNMRWYPFVTGWQVALDLPFAFSATPGHGHRYDSGMVKAWIAVLNLSVPPDKVNQLQNIIF